MAFCLGIIPARGGSKGVIDKNIRPLSEIPLIVRTLQEADKAKFLDDFIVTTDSEKIKKVVEEAGFDVPFLRPMELATDTSKTVDAVRHAVDWYEKFKNPQVDYIVLLQPTSPLRWADDIDKGIQIITGQKTAHSLISCYDAIGVHPSIMYTTNPDGFLVPYDKAEKVTRRQDFQAVYVRNGALYITENVFFQKENRLICDSPCPLLMERSRSINIDDELDLILAETLLRQV